MSSQPKLSKGEALLKELLSEIVTEFRFPRKVNSKNTLRESKQQTINLGFPEVVAALFSEKFGAKDTLVARWYKEYKNHGAKDALWFSSRDHGGFSGGGESLDVNDLVAMYTAAASGNAEAYLKARVKAGLPEDEKYFRPQRSREEIIASTDLAKSASMLRGAIKSDFFENIFFSKDLIKDIESGKLNDVGQFSKLDFVTAQDKYDTKRSFIDKPPLKTYSNGWKWVDVGPTCQLIGKLMKNCGSAGVMSLDPKKTMLTLTDENNSPHVVVTWSPTEKRISGDEGGGSTAVKSEYQDYVFDISKELGATFDFTKTKSSAMKYKGLFGDTFKSSEEVNPRFSKITLKNGEVWYSDRYKYLSQRDLEKLAGEQNVDISVTDDLVGLFTKIFNGNSFKELVAEYDMIEKYNPGGRPHGY